MNTKEMEEILANRKTICRYLLQTFARKFYSLENLKYLSKRHQWRKKKKRKENPHKVLDFTSIYYSMKNVYEVPKSFMCCSSQLDYWNATYRGLCRRVSGKLQKAQTETNILFACIYR